MEVGAVGAPVELVLSLAALAAVEGTAAVATLIALAGMATVRGIAAVLDRVRNPTGPGLVVPEATVSLRVLLVVMLCF